MQKTQLLLVCLLFYMAGRSQTFSLGNYNWDEHPALHTIDSSEKDLPLVVLKDNRVYEYVYDDGGNLNAVQLHHMILRLNSDDAIDANNKVYLPSTAAENFLIEKARVINSKGKVFTFSADEIKESVDEETQSTHRYFALDGIDKGSEIEYFFVVRMSSDISGSQVVLQSYTPKHDVDFTLMTPINLVMTAKSYNGLPDMKTDSTVTDYNKMDLHLDKLAGLKDEDFSNRDANLKYVIFKLDKNTAQNIRDAVRYSKYADATFGIVNVELSGSANKKLSKLIKEMELPSTGNEAKIRAAENFIKTNFRFEENATYATEDLATVLETRTASKYGLLRLYAALFNELGIDYQMVVTCSRYDLRFDPDFECFNFLEDFLLYFPSVGKYMVLTDVFSRLGYITTGYMNNYALFIKPVEAGGVKMAAGQVKFIDPLPYTSTTDHLNMTVDLNQDIDNPLYTMHREQSGYYSQSAQIIYDYLDEEGKKKVTEAQVTDLCPNAEIEKVTLQNNHGVSFGVDPLITDATFHTSEFIEKAGNKYLFKVGMLIGPQAEIYDDTLRTMEVENGFNRWYHRVLTFTIPDGYTCANLDDLKMNTTEKKNGKTTMTFVSDYKQTGNQIVVTIDEYYDELVTPLSEYERFRSVVNASANFNKILLVFDKSN